MHRNLGQFIEALKAEGELAVIPVEADPKLEITEIYDRIIKKTGPALLFPSVKGSDFPLAINLFGSFRRMSLALGVKDLEDISARISEMLDMKVPETWTEKIKMLPRLNALQRMTPKIVKSAPCQEVVETVPDLGRLPVLQCWPGDAGRYITLPMVVTRDPETGIRNVGTYRMQVFDGRTTGMHWQIHKDGTAHARKFKEAGKKRIEVAVAIGADPATMFSAVCPLPYGVDEFVFSGFLRNEPVALVKCKTVDLEVPAESEFVLEGYVDVDERRVEGPFGDHTGYYSLAKEFPVFHVECVTRRHAPVYPTTVVGRPPQEDAYMGKAIERIFLPLLRTQLPEIVDMNLPVEGVFTNCVLVSIKKSYPQHAKKIMHSMWGLGQLVFEKMVLVFDDDVDIHDKDEVAWRAFANVDPKRDMVFTEGPLDELDISSSYELYGSKVGVDCTRKWREEGMQRPWPPDIVMDESVKQLVTKRWKEYKLDERGR
ncbi:MAG: menaquinone biosynthesis decarboxylase [Candidatus Omnitrophica bacterium]|nr:menaquinone biosynthesis decarboxylase [Candidatus Omnitrophota bacterium]